MKRPGQPAKQALPQPSWKGEQTRSNATAHTTEELATTLYRVDPDEDFEELDPTDSAPPTSPKLSLRGKSPPPPLDPEDHVSTLLVDVRPAPDARDPEAQAEPEGPNEVTTVEARGSGATPHPGDINREPDAPADVPTPRKRTTTFPVGGPIAVADPELWDDDPFYDDPPAMTPSQAMQVPKPHETQKPTPQGPLPAIPDNPEEIRKLLADQTNIPKSLTRQTPADDSEVAPKHDSQTLRNLPPPQATLDVPEPRHRTSTGKWTLQPTLLGTPQPTAAPQPADSQSPLDDDNWQQTTLHGVPRLSEEAASRPPSNQLARLPPQPVPAGSQVAGRYRVMATVGETPYGLLVRAVDEQDDKQVYLQMISMGCIANSSDRATLASRARSVSRFRDENLASVLDYGEHNGAPFFATEYVSGPTLAELLARRREGSPPTIDEAFRVLYPLSRALDALHSAGITHGAIRPDRIIVGPHFRVVLNDLGPASLLCNLGDRQTAPYQAPEVRARGRVTPSADLYSLAIIAYTLFTGEQPPVPSDDYRSVVLPSLCAYHPELPAELDRLLQAATSDDPGKRPASPKVLMEELDRTLDTLRGGRRCSRILIVDRDPSVHRFLVPLVARSFSYTVEVESASSFEDARARILTHKPELVIGEGDPACGGPQLIELLRNRPRSASAALILTVPEPTPQRELELDFNTQLRTPLDPTALITTVRRMFGVSGDGLHDPAGLVVTTSNDLALVSTAPTLEAPALSDTADTIVVLHSNNRVILAIVAVILVLLAYVAYQSNDTTTPPVAHNPPAQANPGPLHQPTTNLVNAPQAPKLDTVDDTVVADSEGIPDPDPDPGPESEEIPQTKPRKKQKSDKTPRTNPSGEAASSRCTRVRKAAKQASKMLDWNGMLRQLQKTECWSSSLERRKLKTKALMELKRFPECARTGEGHPDSKVQSWVALCKKRK